MNIYKFRFTRIMFCFRGKMNPFILLYHVINNELGTSKEMVTSWTLKKEAASSS